MFDSLNTDCHFCSVVAVHRNIFRTDYWNPLESVKLIHLWCIEMMVVV